VAAVRPYEIELWTRTGVRIADITRLCQDISMVEERNEAEELRFNLDLDVFEKHMLAAGIDVVSNFREGQTEIKVKRRGEYLFGTQLYDASIFLDGTNAATINVIGFGYLNFLKDRYPDPAVSYTQVESVEIFYDLIRCAQSVDYGDYGLIIPEGGYYVTGKLRDRNFQQYTSGIKLNMQRLTDLVDGNFDFRVLPDKTVMTYPQVGSLRTDFRITYDRTNKRSTFMRAMVNRSVSGTYNSVIGLGTGFGDDILKSVKADVYSQMESGVRELPVQFNEVVEQSTLDENTQARLERVNQLLRLPQVTLSGANMPENRINVGDYVVVEFKGHRLLEDMTGVQRVERIETSLDGNLFEKSVTLYFEKVGEVSDYV
jgi:hypothetical protein